MNKIKKYVKERDEMLKKCDVNELRKFVNDHKDYYSADFIEAFNEASDGLVEITLHKMIVNATNLPFKLKEKSAFWLIERGYSLDL